MSGEREGEARSTPSGGPPTRGEERKEHWFTSILWAVLLALGIRHFLVQAYKIPSGSMIPTLLVGDQLIANKLAYGIRLPFFDEKLVKFSVPEYGEVVVFRYPGDHDKDYIKRTIARPGDRVWIDEGRIFVNGEELRRELVGSYSYERAPGYPVSGVLYREHHGDRTYQVLYAPGDYHPYWSMPELRLGPDEIFVMGDNRDHSNDSRAWGPVDLDLLEGRPWIVHFSWDGLHNRIRWSRIGTRIN